jgi:phosphohistidine phosphatase
MNLYLVRHAIAGVRDPNQWPDDSLRPLTKKGARRFRKAALGLGRFTPPPDVVLSSPYARAWQTAEILAEEVDWPNPEACDALKEYAPSDVMAALASHASAATVALVGHEPYLSALTLTLMGQSPRTSLEMKKGAAACVRLEQLNFTNPGILLWSLPPRAMRALV